MAHDVSGRHERDDDELGELELDVCELAADMIGAVNFLPQRGARDTNNASVETRQHLALKNADDGVSSVMASRPETKLDLR